MGPTSDLHLYIRAGHSDTIAGNTSSSGRRKYIPTLDVKRRSMPGTRYGFSLHRAFGKRTPSVRTRIIDGVIAPFKSEESDDFPADLHLLGLARS
jgi:hypothetical protein